MSKVKIRVDGVEHCIDVSPCFDSWCSVFCEHRRSVSMVEQAERGHYTCRLFGDFTDKKLRIGSVRHRACNEGEQEYAEWSGERKIDVTVDMVIIDDPIARETEKLINNNFGKRRPLPESK